MIFHCEAPQIIPLFLYPVSPFARKIKLFPMQGFYSQLVMRFKVVPLLPWWIQGRGLGHPLFLNQTEARRAGNFFSETPFPPSPPPPTPLIWSSGSATVLLAAKCQESRCEGWFCSLLKNSINNFKSVVKTFGYWSHYFLYFSIVWIWLWRRTRSTDYPARYWYKTVCKYY